MTFIAERFAGVLPAVGALDSAGETPAAHAPRFPRRAFLAACGSSVLAFATPPGFCAEKVTLAEAFDREVEAFMQARGIPGGALAVVKDRRLVYARGYGWANREKQIPARPDSLFRIASISKPITSVAVLKLVEQGRLDLEARAFDLLKADLASPANSKRDPRLAQVTVRHLLQHTGGWDRDKSFDPMFRSRRIAREVGEPSPASAKGIIRYMLSRQLDFDPGTRYAYSNFGYCVLGRVIEAISGESYEAFAKREILAPIGIQRARLGATLAPAEGEARYYLPKEELTETIFPGTPKRVPWPYGGFCLEAMDAHGGWIASAIDLARFAAALDDPEHSPMFKKAGTWRTMLAPPPPPVSRRSDGTLEPAWYGCGWSVRFVSQPAKVNFWHTGSLPGTFSLLVRRHDHLIWAVVFNQRSEDPKLPDDAIDPAMHRAAAQVTELPERDLFNT